MPLTKEQVAKICGLQDPLNYRITRKSRPIGNTTEMLCEVVAKASHGHKCGIIFHDNRITIEMVEKAKAMAVKCEVNDQLITGIPLAVHESSIISGDIRKFYDHHMIDQAIEKHKEMMSVFYKGSQGYDKSL